MTTQPPSEMTATKAADPPAQPEGWNKTLTIDQRMLAVVNRIDHLEKNGTAPDAIGGFKFATAADVKAEVRAQLVRVGVVAYPSITHVDVEVMKSSSGRQVVLATVRGTLTFVSVDDRAQVVVNEIAGQGTDGSDKAVSKAITSAIKYGLLNAFTIPVGDDPDASADRLPEAEAAVYGPPVYGPNGQSRPATQPPAQAVQQAPAQAPVAATSFGDGQPLPPEPNAAPVAAQQAQGPRAATAAPQQQTSHQQRGGDDKHRCSQGACGWPSGAEKCTQHHRFWLDGDYGWYCSGKGGPETNEKGYCAYIPSDEWAAGHER